MITTPLENYIAIQFARISAIFVDPRKARIEQIEQDLVKYLPAK